MRPAAPEARRPGAGRRRTGGLLKPLDLEGGAGLALLALLLALAGALLLPSLQSAPLERAEIYFLDGARGMLESGDYLVPRYRGEAFFDKPPLTYWLIAGAFRLEGLTPRAARLVPATAALGAILACFALGALLLGRRAALAGAFALATTLAFVSFGRIAMSDMLLTLFSTLALATALLALRPAPPRWALPALGAVLGLGFLTKGPVALLLPGLGIALAAWRRWREGWRPGVGGLAAAAALFALIGFSWFVAVYARLGWEPLGWFFLRENLQRFAGETYDTGRAPWYYVGTYLAEGVPWSLFFPLAAARALRGGERGQGARFLLAWLGLMAIPLSLSRGKLDYYLLPLYPAFSLVVGHYFSEAVWSRLDRAWARGVLLLLAASLLAAALFPTRIPAPWLPPASVRQALAAVVASGALALLFVAWRTQAPRVLLALGGAMSIVGFALFTQVLPAFRSRQPNLAVARDVARELSQRPDARLALCADPTRVQRDVLFQARLAAEEHCDLWNPASSRTPFLLLVRQHERNSLERIPGVRVVGEYRYVPATALTLSGLWRRYDADELVLMANYPTQDEAALARAKRERKQSLREQDGPAPAAGSAPARKGPARRKRR